MNALQWGFRNIIFADDLGYGDVGSHIRTPNLNRMAQDERQSLGF